MVSKGQPDQQDDCSDKMMDAGAEFLESQRHEAGITDGLVERTSMTNDEVAALELFQINAPYMNKPDHESVRKAISRLLLFINLQFEELQRTDSKIDRQVADHKRGIMASVAICGVFFMLWIALTSNSLEIRVETDGPRILAVSKTWWGLNEKTREIRWKATSEYDYPAWMAKAADGTWYPYLVEDDRP